MMRRNIVRTGLITACAAMMLFCPVSVSAAEPAEAAAVPAEAGADPAQALQVPLPVALPQTAPADHETALLQSAQAEVVLRGLRLTSITTSMCSETRSRRAWVRERRTRHTL